MSEKFIYNPMPEGFYENSPVNWKHPNLPSTAPSLLPKPLGNLTGGLQQTLLGGAGNIIGSMPPGSFPPPPFPR